MRKLAAAKTVLALLLTLGFALSAQAAEKYPSKTINYLVGWAVGNGVDVDTRQLTNEAAQILNTNFNIQNLDGTSGIKAYAAAKNAKPDGYTLTTLTVSVITQDMAGAIAFGHRDFEYITGLSRAPQFLLVPMDSPYKDVRDIIEAAKANPGKLLMGFSVPGSPQDLALRMMMKLTGAQFRLVSNKGSAAASVVALAGGHIDCALANAGTAVGLIKSGKIRAVGVMHNERLEAFPDTQTFAEAGYPLEFGIDRMIVAPKGTPKEVIDILYKAFKEARTAQKWKDHLEASSTLDFDFTPEQAAAHMDKLYEAIKPIMQETGQYKKKE